AWGLVKRRSEAAGACGGGAVAVNAGAAKPAGRVRAGARGVVTLPRGRRRILKVAGLDDRRGSAEVAKALFEDLTPPEPPRPRQARPPWREPGTGRPTKRERRDIERLRGH